MKTFGTIHVALTSAGIATVVQTLSKKLEPMNTATFDKVMQVNLMGSVYVAKYASVVMAKNKPINDKGEKGLILFVSSNLA